MKKSMIALMLVLVMATAPSLAFAASPWMDAKTYQEKSVGKFKFGFKNMIGGWTEIFSQTQSSCCNKEAAKLPCCRFLRGLGKGLVHATLDTVGGALHIVTFLLPQIDIPLPENGVSF
ncbi:MAG: hypothetical protein EXS63_04770 [Candidatus Omnitrophica bacterium]|nr:hypothetical protein [Candidatus Omnitrophota bacterium]